jgi:hypothetical protein
LHRVDSRSSFGTAGPSQNPRISTRFRSADLLATARRIGDL